MFTVNKKSSRLNEALQLESPNCDSRPVDELSLIVIHGISLPPAEFGGQYIDKLFTNKLDPEIHPYFEEIKNLRVSSHLLIERNGTVKQFVPFNMRAWHAGESVFNNRNCCNDFSIGIELEGTDDIAYTDIQYDIVQQLCVCLQKAYPAILTQNIVGHCDIAPGRKTDPGASFDWQRFKAKLA